jgi:hypothetical protein
MKKPATGESDKLRAIEKDPELRALVERYFVARPSEREPYEAFLGDFSAKASALHPNWQEAWEAAKSDGRIVRWLAMHCALRIRGRSDLTERERYEAKTAEADFVRSFDEAIRAPSAAAAFRMTLAFYNLMGIAKLDPEEIEELRRRAVRDNAVIIGKIPKKEGLRTAHANKLIRKIAKDHPEFRDAEIVDEIPNRWTLKGLDCFKTRWLEELVRRWRRGDDGSPRPTSTRANLSVAAVSSVLKPFFDFLPHEACFMRS